MTASNSPNAFLRRAEPSDAGTVQRISAEAYAPAHLAVIGAVPKPATEDHRPRIGRGEVWILEAQGDPRGIIVLEEKPDHLLVYSVAVGPGHQGRGHGAALLSFADRQARASGVHGAERGALSPLRLCPYCGTPSPQPPRGGVGGHGKETASRYVSWSTSFPGSVSNARMEPTYPGGSRAS